VQIVFSYLQTQRLKKIDVSQCKNLTERGVRVFLNMVNVQIEGFKCAHNLLSSTDYSLEPLRYAKFLKVFNISFCNNLSSNVLQYLLDAGATLEEFYLASFKLDLN
jgi:hypothetical protein